MRLLEYPYTLPPQSTVLDLHVEVGTPGLGDGTFAALSVEKEFPEDMHPTVQMTFRSKSDAKKTLKRHFSLKQRC